MGDTDISIKIQPDGKLAKNGPKILMVTERSATSTGLTAAAEEENISFNTDHSGLVKYESRNQLEYQIVQEKVKSLVARAKIEVHKRFAEDNSR